MAGVLGIHAVNLVEGGYGTEVEHVIILVRYITENHVQDRLLNHHSVALLDAQVVLEFIVELSYIYKNIIF